MIKSILDTDLYKLTMQMAVCHHYPYAQARYEFINRGETKFPEGFDEILKEAVGEMSVLELTNDEKEFLLIMCPYLSPVYLDSLAAYRFNPKEVKIRQEEGDLKITIEGPW